MGYWRDELLPASIGGVPFQAVATSASLGRRGAIHEFPGTNFVHGQDLGAKAKRFSIQGYLIGRDYHEQRKRLEAVFDRPGPHVLVHPHRGRMSVYVDGDADIAESRERGGYCTVAFKVIQASEDTGTPTESAADLAEASIDDARAAATETVGEAADVSTATAAATVQTAAEPVAETLSTTIGSTVDTTTSTGITVAAAIAGMDAAIAAASTAAGKLQAITSVVRSVMTAPLSSDFLVDGAYGELTGGQRITAVVGIGRRLVGAVDNGLEALTAGCLSSALGSGATAAEIETRNAQVVTAAVRIEAAATLLASVLDTPPESTDQARDVLAAIEELLVGVSSEDPDAVLYAVDADAFATLADLRVMASRYLAAESLNLPKLATYTTPSVTNALLLSQLLLGDASRWAEIAERNDIEDPLLVPAGAEIEYLRPA